MRRLLLLLAIVAGPWPPLSADYARPAQHGGLRDIVLVYRMKEPRTAKELLPLVAHVDTAGKPQAWFFDGFLFTPSGEWAQPKTQAHTEAWLDAVFGERGLLPELEQAMAEAERHLGPPPAPRQVMVSIPRPNPGGPAETHLPWVERLTDETIRRWRDADPRHLRLWGMYWYWEEITPRDRPLVRAACAAVHRRGLKMLWIPWFRANGWDRWRETGFDLAILQPNYAFMPPLAGRHLPDESRLSETARLAREAGLGVEIETGYGLATAARDRANLRLYLNTALAEGFAGAVRAHFHSLDQYQRAAASPLPEARQLYDDVFALAAGRLQERPLSLLHGAAVQRSRAGGPAEAVSLEGPAGVEMGVGEALDVRLEPPRELGEARVRLVAGEQGTGLRSLSLYGRTPEEGEWRLLESLAEAPPEGGWLLSTWYPRALSGLRVVAEPFPGRKVTVSNLVAHDCGASTGSPDNLALGRGYVIRPPFKTRYPDSGGELTDGLLTEEGFADGRTVGWSGAPRVIVEIPLPEPTPVESVRCLVQGGGYAAVHAPRGMSAAVSDDGVRWRLLGEAPLRVEPAPAKAGVPKDLTLQWLCHDAPAGGEKARWVRVTLAPYSWLMLSEVEVLSGGRNVALKQPYRFRPGPRGEGQYADDGVKLTDGNATTSWGGAVGWNGCGAEVEVDLGRLRRVRAVRAFVLGGGAGAVFLPRSVAVSLSTDGETWSDPVPAPMSRPEEKDAALGVWATAEVAPAKARYARIRLEPSRGWMMLGEVEVLSGEGRVPWSMR